MRQIPLCFYGRTGNHLYIEIRERLSFIFFASTRDDEMKRFDNGNTVN